MAQYRVREDVVERFGSGVCRRMFRAEKIEKIFWLLPLWVPVEGGTWRTTAQDAERDIEYEKSLRDPPLKITYYS